MELPTGTVLLDPNFGTTVVNATEVSNEDIYRALSDDGNRALMRTFEEWAQNTSGGLRAYAEGGQSGSVDRRAGNLWHRDRYVMPGTFVDQMRLARTACLDDDIVAGVAETTESLAFSSMSFFAEDREEQDVYNQVARKLDLDSRLREIWRELFCVSQVYVAVSRGRQSFKVRGTTKEGNQRRKVIDLIAPKRITLLDPCKVVPVGSPYGSAFTGVEMFAYCAELTEGQRFGSITNGELRDEVVEELVTGRYTPDRDEAAELDGLGYNTSSMWLLDPTKVFRHTLTVPGFRRVAEVRLKAIFELLDMKHQLRQMERAHLIGGPLRTDQRVPTPGGWKAIGAIEVGDSVYSVDGHTTRITGVFPQGVLPMFKVTFTDGAVVYCDESHPWTVFDRTGRSRTIRLRQIMDEGLHQQNGAGRIHAHRIPIAAPLDLPEADLPLDPYLVGYLIGNGSLAQSIPKITSAPGDEAEWQRVLPADMTVTQYEKRPGMCPQYGLKGSRWRYNEVTEALRDLGLWGHTCADKFIPERYLWSSVEQRWALLQGLCDSDGHSPQRGGVEYSTVSEKLAEHVVQLAQSLGCLAKVATKASRREQERPLHRVWISVPQGGEPFRLARKRTAWRPRLHPMVRAMASIERSFDAEAVCIKTDRDDGIFLTEGMVATHNTNFIVLVTKGTDQHPALPQEVANLQAQVRTVARVPILVGDHRLRVEIVTPKLDNTLRAERWNTIDSRITARCYGMFMLGNYSAGASGDDSVKLVKVVARGMESRRHMIVRSLEKQIFDPLFEGNEVLKSRPKIQFHPRSIALDFDAAFASFLFDLRQAKEISRETILNQFDLDQDLEAELRQRESEEYDEIFQTQVPFSTPSQGAPGPADPAQKQDPAALPRDNGGGRRSGGGAAPGSGQGQDPRRRAKRAAVKKAAAGAAQKLTITIEGADDLSSEDLAAALRAALKPGEDHAHAPDEA